MPLSEDEARNQRHLLESTLRSRELSWIVDNANERITLGKTVRRRITVADGFFASDSSTGDRVEGRRRPRRQQHEFLASEPFNEVEKLQILLDAIRYGLVSLPRMQQSTIQMIGPEVVAIEFSPELDETAAHHVFTKESMAQGAATEFETALEQLGEAIRT